MNEAVSFDEIDKARLIELDFVLKWIEKQEGKAFVNIGNLKKLIVKRKMGLV